MNCQKCNTEVETTYRCTCGCSITHICEECRKNVCEFTLNLGIDTAKFMVRN